jgi:membrane protein YdbS with pleckstrin-like domain
MSHRAHIPDFKIALSETKSKRVEDLVELQYVVVLFVFFVEPIGSMVLLYMVCHGSHQYTPFMLALIYQHHGSYGVWDGFIETP